MFGMLEGLITGRPGAPAIVCPSVLLLLAVLDLRIRNALRYPHA